MTLRRINWLQTYDFAFTLAAPTMMCDFSVYCTRQNRFHGTSGLLRPRSGKRFTGLLCRKMMHMTFYEFF
jgi:hypothetical protein